CRISRSAISQGRAGRGMLTARITRLDHKAADDTMEQDAVIIPFLYQGQKVISMQWSGVGQPKHNNTFRCDHLYILVQIVLAQAIGQPGVGGRDDESGKDE